MGTGLLFTAQWMQSFRTLEIENEINLNEINIRGQAEKQEADLDPLGGGSARRRGRTGLLFLEPENYGDGRCRRDNL